MFSENSYIFNIFNNFNNFNNFQQFSTIPRITSPWAATILKTGTLGQKSETCNILIEWSSPRLSQRLMRCSRCLFYKKQWKLLYFQQFSTISTTPSCWNCWKLLKLLKLLKTQCIWDGWGSMQAPGDQATLQHRFNHNTSSPRVQPHAVTDAPCWID